MEHLHEHFAMKTFDHLEQSFADDQLNNFLVTLESCPQYHKILIKKSNPPAKLYQMLKWDEVI